MDPRSSFGVLGRALLRLGAGGATGVVEVQAPATASIGLSKGAVYALQWPDSEALIGDVLGLDPAQHASALARSLPGGVVGQWLVREGLTSEAELSFALRRQLRQRMTTLLSRRRTEVRYHPGERLGATAIPEPLDAVDLVLHAVRRASQRVSARRLRIVEPATWRMSALADEALGRAALAPIESALLGMLRLHPGGLSGRELVNRLGARLDAYRALYAWSEIGLLASLPSGSRAHQRLLRKRNQLRSQQPAHALLELDERTSPRRALRQLARDLHPDRFDAELRGTSTEIFQALVAAEERLR